MFKKEFNKLNYITKSRIKRRKLNGKKNKEGNENVYIDENVSDVRLPNNWKKFYEKYGYDKLKSNKVINRLYITDKKKYEEYSKLEITPNSIIKKHYKWVSNIYTPFSKLFQKNPFPLQPKTVSAFLKFCLIECQYTMKTVLEGIIPTLKYKEREHTKKFNINEEVLDAISITINSIKNQKNYNPGGNGKEPCTYKDLYNIILSMDIYSFNYEEEISLYLLALNCGARACSIANIKIGDILQVNYSSLKETENNEMKKKKYVII